MKRMLSMLFIFFAAYSSVYSSDSAKKPFKRVYIGVSVTPEVTYRYLHGNFVPSGNSQQGIQSTVDYGNKHTFPEFGINAAAKVGINLTHWLAVESGVGYYLVRYRYASDPYYTPSVYTGTIYNPGIAYKTSDQETYHYMAVPVGLRFSMGHRTVRGVIAAGVDFDFLLKRKSVYTYTYPDGSTVTNSNVQDVNNFKTFNLSPYLGVGIDCYLSPAAVLRIMPQAQIQSFKNINTPVTEYLWNLGLNVQFLFGL